MNIADAISLFLTDRARGHGERESCSASTLEYYRKVLGGFARHCVDRNIIDMAGLNADVLAGYMGDLAVRQCERRQKPLSQVTRRKWGVTLRTFMGWAYRAELTTRDFAPFVPLPRKPRNIPKAPSQGQVRQLMGSEMDTRTRAVISLMIDTGMRRAEVCALNVDDVDVERGTARVLAGKGVKDRLVVFESTAKAALGAWLALRPTLELRDRRALFVGFNGGRLSPLGLYRLVRHMAEANGLTEDVSPHKLRHFFGTNYLDRGGDLRELQALMGHEDIRQTLNYTYATSAVKLRKHAAFSPLNGLDEKP